MTFSCVLAPCLTLMLTVKTVKISGITVKEAGAPKFAKCVGTSRLVSTILCVHGHKIENGGSRGD